VASNACITVIIGTCVVIIAINWGMSTSRVWVAVIISTCIIVITRNSRFVATSCRITRFRCTGTIINTNYRFMSTSLG